MNEYVSTWYKYIIAVTNDEVLILYEKLPNHHCNIF